MLARFGIRGPVGPTQKLQTHRKDFMTNELLQQRHDELQQRIVLIRESLRQTEAKLQDLHDQEQQILGALAVVREFIQLQPPPEQPPLLDNAA